ncbi:PREDICTED: uncharacterized protein LOC105564448 [Vollenhovia emeryi]|uniref:uncharacterized protein LOC105564448 n=1 Tax=Vollenhovia emeryi TaxID=411798 RepID=UPI0005F49D14|nr:PREDICTED: uncharacterized protein LOC105564448 [Vollenhovia emeryi]
MLEHDNIGYMKWGSPMFKGPFTDLFLNVRTLQFHKECAQYELQYVDCMEAYGYHRGKEKCRLILEDMYECVFKVKRMRRVMMMAKERHRQFNNGERTNEFEETPPLDLY